MSGCEEFTVCLSVTLALEYEEILQRYRADFAWDEVQVKRFLAGLYNLVEETPIYFRWRPFCAMPMTTWCQKRRLRAAAQRL